MNPNLCRIVLRPRNPLSSFDMGLRLMREHWGLYAKLTALFVLPGFLISWPILWATSGSWWVALPFFVMGWLLQAPFTLLTGRLLFSDDIEFRPFLGQLWASAGPLASGFMIEVLTLLLGLVTCGLSWLVSLFGWSFLTETMVLERLGAGAGVGRAMRLAGAHPGNAIGVALGRLFLSAWLVAICEVGGGQLTSFVLQLGHPLGSVLNGQLTPWVILGFGLAQPLVAVYRMMLYVDLRTRVEGWDLQVGLRAVGLGT